MKFTIMAALCVIFCAACAGVTPEQRQQFASLVEPTVAPSPNSFILDQRDPKSKTTHYVGAFMNYNCEFGVDSFGDIGGASDKIARLERDLAAAFGPQPETPKAVLRKYSVYQNRAFDLIGNGGSGLVGELVAASLRGPGDGQHPRCARDKMKGGWFDTADVTNENSPFTVDIDITFQGRDYVVTAAHSPPIEIKTAGQAAGGSGSNASSNKLDQPEWIATIQAAMAKANARLIDAIKSASSAQSGVQPARQ